MSKNLQNVYEKRTKWGTIGFSTGNNVINVCYYGYYYYVYIIENTYINKPGYKTLKLIAAISIYMHLNLHDQNQNGHHFGTPRSPLSAS